MLLRREVKWSLDAMYQCSLQLLTLGYGAVLLKDGQLDVFACKTGNHYDLSSPDL
ncbi:MAG: hypothetical protein PG977_001141 [Bartonella clarridgeiae]|nr:MAG: hypothetical protein PG977_001141 [Bartonella clarridgeiae]